MQFNLNELFYLIVFMNAFKKPLKIAVLASGKATSMQGIIDAIKKKELNAEISVLISDKENSLALKNALKNNIEGVFLNPKNFSSREEFDMALSKELEKRGIELVCLIGFMRFLSSLFVKKWRNKIINVHPSILPSFPGMDLNVHKAVLEHGCKVSGATIFFVDESKDNGPIILQECVKVMENDSPESLKARVQELEKKLLPKAIKLFYEKKLEIIGRRVKILE
jgi:phosphoribosylglycinamide formyltransferase-1